jgi:hypothetical protein
MGVYGGPEIVNDSLVYLVDAGNPQSYAGSGAAWNDLSLTKSVTTLFNTPSFSASTKGSIIFNGTTNYALGNVTVTAKTVIVYANASTFSDGLLYAPAANGNDNWLRLTTDRKISVFATETTDINNFSITSTQTVSPNVWFQAACTIDTYTASVYVNGNFSTSSTKAFIIGPWTSRPYIGRRATSAQFTFSGAVAMVQVYDRVLSATEIEQNFDAHRSRFGI